MEIKPVNQGGVLARLIPKSKEEKIKNIINTHHLTIPEKRKSLILEIHKQSDDPESIEILVNYYESYIGSLKKELEESEKLAGEDCLTGLYTRRIFNRDLENRCEKSDIDERRHEDRRGHFSLIIYDLNNLKVLNDTEGHERGDNKLINLSELIEKNLGTFDNAYRIGGDEFASIHPNTTPEQAIKFAKLIYSKDVSIGISGSHILKRANQTISPKTVYRTADQAMYFSKKSKTKPILWNPGLLNT